jgi:hypothetical protein
MGTPVRHNQLHQAWGKQFDFDVDIDVDCGVDFF